MGGNGRKETPLWLVFLQGIMISFGIYLLAAMAAAGLAVKAVLPEEGVFWFLAVWSLLAVCIGGIYCARRSPWGSLPSAMLCAAGFGAFLIAVGLLCWQGITWLGQGGILLACMAAGGAVAGLLGGRLSKRKKGRRLQRGKRREKAKL